MYWLKHVGAQAVGFCEVLNWEQGALLCWSKWAVTPHISSDTGEGELIILIPVSTNLTRLPLRV